MAGRILIGLIAWTMICACSKPAPPVAPKAKAPAGHDSTHGTIHMANKSLRVAPYVSHEPRMDLRTGCKASVDKAKKAGKMDAELCYDGTMRAAAKTLRLETYTRKDFDVARRTMSAAGDAAHFLILPSGSIYQVLDIAFAPRRQGTIRPDEIRILSADRDKEMVLVEALKAHLPHLVLETIPPSGDGK